MLMKGPCYAENPMRPYVAFNAELRAAFQGCVARMEEHCAALVRHELEVATSAFARRISLACAVPGGRR